MSLSRLVRLGCLSLAVLLSTALLPFGCAPLDLAPLAGQDFYQRTLASLEEIRPLKDPPQPSLHLKAGAARVEITPAKGVPLAGYGNRLGRGATGMHDRLYTRALALSDGEQTVILIANDLLAITNHLYEAVFEKISSQVPIRPESLMIAASHTHSGPGAIAKKFWEGFAAGPFDPQLFETLTQKTAQM